MKTEIIQLNDIDFERMKLIKETFKWYGNQDHSRWVFKDHKNTLGSQKNIYLKLWNPTYIRRENILKAIESGFLDEKISPAFYGLIFHNGICRGYALQECKRNLKLDMIEEYYSLIKERTKQTQYFHIQFSPCHVMKYQGKFSLIDLEGFFPISDIEKMPQLYCYFDYKDYEDFVLSLYNQSFSHSNSYRIPDDGQKKFREIHPFLRITQSFLMPVRNIFHQKRDKHINQIYR